MSNPNSNPATPKLDNNTLVSSNNNNIPTSNSSNLTSNLTSNLSGLKPLNNLPPLNNNLPPLNKLNSNDNIINNVNGTAINNSNTISSIPPTLTPPSSLPPSQSNSRLPSSRLQSLQPLGLQPLPTLLPTSRSNVFNNNSAAPLQQPISSRSNAAGGSAFSNAPLAAMPQHISSRSNTAGGSAFINNSLAPISSRSNAAGGSAFINNSLAPISSRSNAAGGSAFSINPLQSVKEDNVELPDPISLPPIESIREEKRISVSKEIHEKHDESELSPLKKDGDDESYEENDDNIKPTNLNNKMEEEKEKETKTVAKLNLIPSLWCHPCVHCMVSIGLPMCICDGCLMTLPESLGPTQQTRSTGEVMDEFFTVVGQWFQHSETCRFLGDIFGCNCANVTDDMRNGWLACIYSPVVFFFWGRCRSAITGIPADKERNFYNDVRRVLLRQDEGIDIKSVENLFTSCNLARDALFKMTIHGCDELIVDRYLLHPMLRITLVDITTGEYLFKSDPNRSVLYASENNNKSSKHILPCMTEPYTLKGTGSFSCIWAEDILFNEVAEHLLKPTTLALFEVVEFGARVDLNENPDGLRTICWGFLRLLSSKGKPNFGRLRIQLYHLAEFRPVIERPHTPDIYFEYLFQRNVERFPYPSTIHLTCSLHEATQPKPIRGFRPQNALQLERGKVEFSELWKSAQIRYASISDASISALLLQPNGKGGMLNKGGADKNSIAGLHSLDMAEARALRRYRPMGQICEIPDTYLFKVGCGQSGVSYLKFSPDGRFLAAATGEYALFPIKVFDVRSGALLFTFLGHHNYVYEMQWSADSAYIISCSSDQTVRVWDFEARSSREVQVFGHPSFVYSVQIHPRLTMIATGSYDGILRLWDMKTGDLIESHDDHLKPSKESTLESVSVHQNNLEYVSINSLVFSSDGDRLFTVDSSGIIRIWQLLRDLACIPNNQIADFNLFGFVVEQRRLDKINRDSNPVFTCIKALAHGELSGVIIGTISYSQYGGERLVVYARDSSLYLFNGFTLNLRLKLNGSRCSTRNMQCLFSPDGSKIMAASEDGKIYFWDCQNGHLLKVIDPNIDTPITAIAWHPSQHLIVCSSFGVDYPIFFYEFAPQEVASSSST